MYEYFYWPVAKKRDTGARPVENRGGWKRGLQKPIHTRRYWQLGITIRHILGSEDLFLSYCSRVDIIDLISVTETANTLSVWITNPFSNQVIALTDMTFSILIFSRWQYYEISVTLGIVKCDQCQNTLDLLLLVWFLFYFKKSEFWDISGYMTTCRKWRTTHVVNFKKTSDTTGDK